MSTKSVFVFSYSSLGDRKRRSLPEASYSQAMKTDTDASVASSSSSSKKVRRKVRRKPRAAAAAAPPPKSPVSQWTGGEEEFLEVQRRLSALQGAKSSLEIYMEESKGPPLLLKSTAASDHTRNVEEDPVDRTCPSQYQYLFG